MQSDWPEAERRDDAEEVGFYLELLSRLCQGLRALPADERSLCLAFGNQSVEHGRVNIGYLWLSPDDFDHPFHEFHLVGSLNPLQRQAWAGSQPHFDALTLKLAKSFRALRQACSYLSEGAAAGDPPVLLGHFIGCRVARCDDVATPHGSRAQATSPGAIPREALPDAARRGRTRRVARVDRDPADGRVSVQGHGDSVDLHGGRAAARSSGSLAEHGSTVRRSVVSMR